MNLIVFKMINYDKIKIFSTLVLEKKSTYDLFSYLNTHCSNTFKEMFYHSTNIRIYKLQGRRLFFILYYIISLFLFFNWT